MGIAVLGPMTLDGTGSLGRRDRMVLSALTVHPGDVVSADRLADVLWGDDPPASAAKVIQGCVVRLRKALGPRAIETSPAGYRLAVPLAEIDTQRFERAVEHARDLLASGEPERASAVLSEALALWRGDPLSELEGWDVARIEASRLGELRLEADELYVEATLRSGHHGRVMAKAQAMVREAPLRERRWALLALAQYQAGNQADALRSLRRVRGLLGNELGIDPGPEIEELEQAILRQDPSLVVATALPDPEPLCPYPGLMAYDVADAGAFFGRDKDVAACLRRLRDTNVLAVVGPSGSGKSSLVRAGVAAALERDGSQVQIITPGAHPMSALAALPSAPRITLAVDQCEEVFSLCHDQNERTKFLSALAARAQTGQVIVSLRADRLIEVAAQPEFARMVEQGMFLINAMGAHDLREAVEGPARQAGLVVEPGLVDLLVNEVEHQPGALPMLSHALSETWQRREGRTLTVAGYRDSGGIRGAVAKSAEEIYTGVGPEDQLVLREMLLRLLSPGDDGEPVRTRLPRHLVVTDPAHDDLMDMLIASRLVTSDDGVLELAHDALPRAWPRLHGWLEEDIDGQRIQHHLSIAADSWDALGRPDTELYRGVRLGTALDWRAGADHRLPAVEESFLERGERVADAERVAAAEHARRQSRVNRQLRGLLAVASVLVVATLIAGLVAVRQADRAGVARSAAEDSRESADAAALTANSRRLGARALSTKDISLSMLLAVQGVLLEDTTESRSNLLAALSNRPQLVRTGFADGPLIASITRPEVIRPGVGAGLPITSLAVKRLPDGFVAGAHRWLIATSVGANKVVVFDQAMDRYKFIAVGSRHENDRDVSVAYSPDGSIFAAGMNTADPAPVRLFNTGTYKPLVHQPRRLSGGPSAVVDLDFSRNGRYLAATLESPTAQGRRGEKSTAFALVWESRGRGVPRRVDLPVGRHGLAVSPDGGTIYTSWPLAAYDVSSGRRLWRSTLKGAGHLDINGAGTLIAMPEWDDLRNNNIVLVNTETGTLRQRLLGQGEQVGDVRFSPNGTQLGSTANDGTTLVWDVQQGTVHDRLDTGAVNAVAFSPDGSKLVTGGEDAALRIWDLSGEWRYVARIGTGESIPADGRVHPSPNGLSVAYSSFPSNGGTQRLRFYDVVTGTLGEAIDTGDRGSAGAGSWRPDRQRYATAGTGMVRIWNPDTGRVVIKRAVGASLVTSVAFASDGKHLLLTERSGLVRMIDADTLLPLGEPVDVGGDACCVAPGERGGTAVVFSEPVRGSDGNESSPQAQWNLVGLRDGRVLRSVLIRIDVLSAVASPDRTRVAATGSTGEMALLDALTGKLVRPPVQGHDTDTDSVMFSSDGKQVATAAVDGSVSLWDGLTGNLLGTVGLPEHSPAVAAFRYGDQDLMIASAAGGVYNWNTSEHEAIASACSLAGRTLTRAEWKEFVGGHYRPRCPRDNSQMFAVWQ